ESLENRGFEVIMESDGAKATSEFKRSAPHVCVLDVMLPNKDGFTIADEIRAIDREVPILFLTAKTQTEDAVKGFSIGGNDYIRKPFSMEELIARINNAMRHGTSAASKVNRNKVNFGYYNHNIIRQFVFLRNEDRKPSYREAELLRLLYVHRDRIKDGQEMLDL